MSTEFKEITDASDKSNHLRKRPYYVLLSCDQDY